MGSSHSTDFPQSPAALRQEQQLEVLSPYSWALSAFQVNESQPSNITDGHVLILRCSSQVLEFKLPHLAFELATNKRANKAPREVKELSLQQFTLFAHFEQFKWNLWFGWTTKPAAVPSLASTENAPVHRARVANNILGHLCNTSHMSFHSMCIDIFIWI